MTKKEIELYFGGADTSWIVDTDIHDKEFVMVGFEEHYDNKRKAFKTEQLFDVSNLKLLKTLIDKTLEQLENDKS